MDENGVIVTKNNDKSYNNEGGVVAQTVVTLMDDGVFDGGTSRVS